MASIGSVIGSGADASANSPASTPSSSSALAQESTFLQLLVARPGFKSIESVLTVLNGAVVHATGDFSSHAPPALPVEPDWSPVAKFGGYGAPGYFAQHGSACVSPGHIHTAGCGAPVATALLFEPDVLNPKPRTI